MRFCREDSETSCLRAYKASDMPIASWVKAQELTGYLWTFGKPFDSVCESGFSKAVRGVCLAWDKNVPPDASLLLACD
jgi:hypothetical protein